MIDTFQWFVWPADSNIHEGFPFVPLPADSPRARRLLCLMAEARAGGVPTKVLFSILLEWARVLEQHVLNDESRAALIDAITVTDAGLYQLGQPLSESLQHTLDSIDELEAPASGETAALRMARVLVTLFRELLARGGEADPETTWESALVALSSLAQAAAPDAFEPAINDCARLAYARLFLQRQPAE